jgi:hypothetical protein
MATTIRLTPVVAPLGAGGSAANQEQLHSPEVVNAHSSQIGVGTAVRLDVATGGVVPATASTPANARVIGFMLADTALGQAGTVVVGGTARYLLSAESDQPSPGQPLYLSSVHQGKVSTSIPTESGEVAVQVGRASGNLIFIEISRGVVRS